MKRNNILCLSVVLAMGFSTAAYAQDDATYSDDGTETVAKKKAATKRPSYPTKEVKGIIIDAVTKNPLAGIQIQTLNDRNYAAMTNAKGEFTIKVPTFATALYVHAPQYMSQQVAIGDGDIKVVLLADKFKQMYDNSTNITASATAKIKTTTSQTVETDIEDNLGADVRSITRSGGPGYGTAMFVRGLNSLNANAQPLIVVDGVVRDMQPSRNSLHYGDYNNLILNINPEDIEKVTVMKNATAIYGAKGANGVILIDTKRGRSMATRIDANIGVGVTLKPQLPEMMNASQYRLYASEMVGTFPKIADYDLERLQFLNDDPNGYYYKTYHNDTDWSKEVYREALTQNYNINVQGGDNIGMYNLSIGYTDGQSTAKENGFNRLNVRFNTDITIIDKLTTRFDMSFTKINRDVFDNGAPEDFTTAPVSSPTFLGLIKAPILNPYSYNQAGQLSSTLSKADDFVSMLDENLTLGNPTALLENGSAINKNRVENTEFNAVIAPKFQFNDNLYIQETFSYTLNRNSQRYYRPTGGMPIFLIEGIGSVENMAMSLFAKETSVMSDTRLHFNKHLGSHFLDVYGGMRYTSFAFDNSNPKGQYATAANDKTPNISKNMEFKESYGVDDAWKNISWYANIDYNFRNLYFLQVAMSLETSSRFGENADGLSLGGVKWAYFPSVQAGWAISNEKWFPKTSAVNYLLLKAGYDISGNDDINNYAARTSFQVMQYLNNSTAHMLNNIGNDKITYEKTGQFNVGFQSYLLNNRVGVDFNYYRKHTTNLLTLKSFENPVAGINNYWSNGGSLDNEGYEVTLTTKPVVGKNFNIELGASVGHYVNKVKSLPNDDKLYLNGKKDAQGFTSSIYGTDNIATIVGQPVGSFYGYKTAGVFKDDEAAKVNNGNYLYLVDETGNRQYFKAGDMHFVDINGDGEINEADKTIIGNPNPDIYGNIFANVMWKNFSLNIGFNYSLGNDVYNYSRSILEGGNNFYNQTTAMTNRWRHEGQQTSIPRASYGDPMGNSRFSDRWIEDGSYLRLKTLNLSYKVPVKSDWLQGLTVWVEANNLFTISKYLGSDPEFAASNNVLYQGIDTGNIALSRTFTFGMKINL